MRLEGSGGHVWDGLGEEPSGVRPSLAEVFTRCLSAECLFHPHSYSKTGLFESIRLRDQHEDKLIVYLSPNPIKHLKSRHDGEYDTAYWHPRASYCSTGLRRGAVGGGQRGVRSTRDSSLASG